jgi:hypothetical protein
MVVQTYFWTVLSSYSHAQQYAHAGFDSGFGSTNTLTANDIPMTNQKYPWKSRSSTEALTARGYGHARQGSQTSASDVMGDELQQPKDTIDPGRYDETAYPPQLKDVSYPGPAYTQEPVPTPQHSDQYFTGGGSVDMSRPEPSQAHPGKL